MKPRWAGWRGRLPRLAYAFVTKLVPIACVDVLPYRVGPSGVEVGLVQRLDANGRLVWNLVGGGIYRRESIAEAAARHIRTTLGEDVTWDNSDLDEPDGLGEYFPVPVAGAGFDPRKHAIALTYAIPLSGEAVARGEALDFRWFTEDRVPFDEIGFGQEGFIHRLLPIEPPRTDSPRGER
jgi:hypothetical protein